jgi:hypothetical protein
MKAKNSKSVEKYWVWKAVDKGVHQISIVLFDVVSYVIVYQ